MLSFIPFFIFLVSILSLVLAGNEQFQLFLFERISDLFPSITGEITQELVTLIERSEVGFITLLGYLFFSYHLYVSLETAVNEVFRLRGKRSLLRSVANSLLVITLFMALVVVVFGTTLALSLIVHLGEIFRFPQIHFVVGALGLAVPLFLVFLTATALYVYLPRKRVSFKNAMKGAVFTAVLFEAAKYVFTLYVAIKLAQFGPFYGSLTGVVIFLMWLVYSASIFLIGAGLVHKLETGAER
jgi:membrane protein